MGVETAEFLVEVLVELLKSLEENDQTSTFRVRLQSVLENVEKSWPEVYTYRVAMVRGEREGKGHSLSSRGEESKQLEATRPCPPARWYRPWPPGLSWTCRSLKA